MNDRIMIAAAAFCGLIAAPAAAAAPAGRPDGLAVRNVMSWTVPDSRTVYVEDAAGRWFRVDLDTACTPLAGAFGIALATPPGGGFETASALITGGGRCAVRAVAPVPAPALPPRLPFAAFGGK